MPWGQHTFIRMMIAHTSRSVNQDAVLGSQYIRRSYAEELPYLHVLLVSARMPGQASCTHRDEHHHRSLLQM
jgi:hypothetical protein